MYQFHRVQQRRSLTKFELAHKLFQINILGHAYGVHSSPYLPHRFSYRKTETRRCIRFPRVSEDPSLGLLSSLSPFWSQSGITRHFNQALLRTGHSTLSSGDKTDDREHLSVLCCVAFSPSANLHQNSEYCD